VLEPDGTRLKWVIARVPFDVAKVWPERRGLRVLGEIEGFPFRTTLIAGLCGQGTVLVVNKQMREAAKAQVGSLVRIRLEPDLEERAVVIPAEFQRALKGDRRLPKWFGRLSPSMRREVGAWVGEPKTTAARELRAEHMAERLLHALEGETETPPILQAAFLRQPLARQGWEAMTPAQRRNHLLGIFYYQTVEARERRAARAVEEALRRARRAAAGE